MFKRRTRPVAEEAHAVPDRAIGQADVALAYRLILCREPDAEGLAHYLGAASSGLTLRGLLDALLASDEFRDRPAVATAPARSAQSDHTKPAVDLIAPADVARQYSLDELNDAADEYYRRVTDATPLMAKPFAYWHEAPQMLHDLGLLLGGMRMGKAMNVLDFGAGTGWLSRILAQLHCDVVSCDVSASALAIGRALFERYPPVGDESLPPAFLLFDGRRLDLPSESIDRIVSFDAYHHVPNPAQVIREFGRVLRTGGIVGFSEPGRFHSQSPQSQYEMRHHRVLENDIDINALFSAATGAGFTRIAVKGLTDIEFSLDDYNAILSPAGPSGSVKDRAWHAMASAMTNRSVFFLYKGDAVLDSRAHDGLAHRLEVDRADVFTRATEPVRLRFHVENTGSARWLSAGRQIFGQVKLASHLATAEGQMLDVDFSREPLPRDVAPGERLDIAVDVVFPDSGDFLLTFDLVAEGVTWFENLGSRPVQVRVHVS